MWIVITVKEPCLIYMSAEPKNPYDDWHALKNTVATIEQITGVKPKEAYVDRGYKGNENYLHDVQVFVSGKTKGLSVGVKKLEKNMRLNQL